MRFGVAFSVQQTTTTVVEAVQRCSSSWEDNMADTKRRSVSKLAGSAAAVASAGIAKASSTQPCYASGLDDARGIT